MKKRIFTFILVLIGVFCVVLTAQAHQSGCHRWHSCPSDSGSYSCGDLGYPCRYSTYSTSGTTSYFPSTIVLFSFQKVANCNIFAETFDEVNNFNKIYREEYGRNATCDELTFHVDGKTNHSTLRSWLLSQPTGIKYTKTKQLVARFNGRTVIDNSTGELYLVQGGKRHLAANAIIMSLHGLLYKDGTRLSSTNIHLIPRGAPLENFIETDYTAPSPPKEYTITDEKSTVSISSGYHSNNHPLVTWSGARDNIRLDGYFVVVSNDNTTDPETAIDGRYIHTNSWLVPTRYFTTRGEYYIHIKPVDSHGNRGAAVYATYYYDPNAPAVE